MASPGDLPLFPSWTQTDDGVFTRSTCADYPLAKALLADGPALGYFEKYAGLSRDPVVQLRRMVMLISMGMRAERHGEVNQADFFLRRAHRMLARLAGRPRDWDSAAAALGSKATLNLDGARLRTAILSEVFANAHASLYRALAPQIQQSARAAVHLRYLIALRAGRFDPGNEVLAPVLFEQMDLTLEQKRWREALYQAEVLADQFPQREDAALASAHAYYLYGLQAITDVPTDAARIVALEYAIERLEATHSRFPQALPIYHWTADLYLLMAATQRNTHQLPAALLAVERSLHWRVEPADGQAHAFQTSLQEELAQLRAALAKALAAKKPGQTLSDTGRMLQQQAALGSRPAEQFRASRAAADLREGFEAAQQAAHSSPGKRAANLPPLPPALTIDSPVAHQHDVPFAFWFWTLQDKRIKLQLAAAVALVVLVAGLGIREYTNRSERNASFTQLTDAMNQRNYDAALTAAETFLSSPIMAEDSRAESVQRLYAESFVRWFTTQDADSVADDAHVARYRSLIVENEKGKAQ